MFGGGRLGQGKNTPIQVSKAEQLAVKTVNANDGLGGDMLQKYLNHPE